MNFFNKTNIICYILIKNGISIKINLLLVYNNYKLGFNAIDKLYLLKLKIYLKFIKKIDYFR